MLGLRTADVIEDEQARLAAVCDLQLLLYVPVYRRGKVGELLNIVTRAEVRRASPRGSGAAVQGHLLQDIRAGQRGPHR